VFIPDSPDKKEPRDPLHGIDECFDAASNAAVRDSLPPVPAAPRGAALPDRLKIRADAWNVPACRRAAGQRRKKLNIVDHQTKVALKQDQFVTTTAHGLEWASENRKSVITTVAILLAVIVVIVVAAVIYNNRSQAASTAFGDAMTIYQSPVAVPGQPAIPGVKTYATAAERAKAANEAFRAVADQYSLTPDGKTALYFAGLTYMDEGQTQSAEDTLKKVAGGWNKQLASLANLALADLYRQSGRNAQAVEIYNQLTAHPTDSVPAGLAQLQLADLYTVEGKTDEAKKIYAQLKDKDAKGPAGQIAAQKLNPSAAPQM
jgi:tetratricopeptide (TPR) repeat protein